VHGWELNKLPLVRTRRISFILWALRKSSAPGCVASACVALRCARSWPKYRPGYDMPFVGSSEWNAHRYKNPSDEAYFARTDYPAMDNEIRVGLNAFIDKLGGR
jgi:hypothetical protein